MDTKLKLSLLQWQNKFKIVFAAFFLVFIILFCFNFCSATQVSISPPNLYFYGDTYEKICKTITLYGDGELIGEDKWSNERVRDINKYNFNSKFSGITVDYPLVVSVSGEKVINICINASKPGNYYGAIIYSQENAGVGTWINMNIIGENNTKNNLSETIDNTNILTGAVIGSSNINFMIVFVLIEIFMFILLSFYLLRKLYKH